MNDDEGFDSQSNALPHGRCDTCGRPEHSAEPTCPTCGKPAAETCNCLKHHSPDVFGEPEYPE